MHNAGVVAMSCTFRSFNVYTIVCQERLPSLLVSRTQTSPLLKSLHWLPIRYQFSKSGLFWHHNRYTRYTYIGCSLLQEIQGTFGRLILIFISLAALKQVSDPGLFLWPVQLFGTQSLTILKLKVSQYPAIHPNYS